MSEPSAMTGFPDPQRGGPRGGDSGDAPLDLEAVLLEQTGQVLRRLELLHPELTEREDLVDDLLNELGARLDLGRGFGLEAIEAGILGFGPERRRQGELTQRQSRELGLLMIESSIVNRDIVIVNFGTWPTAIQDRLGRRPVYHGSRVAVQLRVVIGYESTAPSSEQRRSPTNVARRSSRSAANVARRS